MPIATGTITDNSNYNNLSYHVGQAASSTAYPNLANYTYEELSRTFYDDYSWRSSYGSPLTDTRNATYDGDFLTPSTTSFPFAEAASQSKRLKNMVTGSRVKVLGTSTWLYSVFFYDEKGRVVQVQSQNITGSTDITTTQEITTSPTNKIAVVVTKMSYDELWRVVKVEKKQSHTDVSGGMSSYNTIVTNKYDELGRLDKKELGSQKDENNDYIDPREELQTTILPMCTRQRWKPATRPAKARSLKISRPQMNLNRQDLIRIRIMAL